MRVAVVGGTGLVGREVVRVLSGRGHDVRVLARSTGVDVVSGRGVPHALAGVEGVVDVSNTGTMRRSAAEDFFGRATATLVEEGARAGIRHHVVLSIVGVDRVDSGYYAGKRRQEEVALAGPVPVSILRATQFHEFAGQVLGRMRVGPVAAVPRMRVQPVAAAEVAEALADLVTGPPVGRATELAGPEVHELPDLARRLLRARGSRALLVPVRLPGAAGRAMADGGLLPTGSPRLGEQTFDTWLAGTVRD